MAHTKVNLDVLYNKQLCFYNTIKYMKYLTLNTIIHFNYYSTSKLNYET